MILEDWHEPRKDSSREGEMSPVPREATICFYLQNKVHHHIPSE